VDMRIKKLYIVNDGAADIDMLMTSCLLNPLNYRLVKGMCKGHEFEDVKVAFHEECIDEVEFEVYKRSLRDVIDDLHYVDTNNVDMGNMIFVAETKDGKYIEFRRSEIRDIIWQEFVEEFVEEP